VKKSGNHSTAREENEMGRAALFIRKINKKEKRTLQRINKRKGGGYSSRKGLEDWHF